MLSGVYVVCGFLSSNHMLYMFQKSVLNSFNMCDKCRSLFHDLLSAPMFLQSVWSAITAHKLTPAKRDVNTVVSDQRPRFTAPSIGDYSTPDTVAKHRCRK